MKKGIITIMALMLGLSGMMAQNTVVVAGSGDVSLKQGEVLEVRCEGQPITFTLDGKIVLSSYKDYDLTMPDLRDIRITGAGDVHSEGTLSFPTLDILISGTGDADLTVECDTIKATLTGTGDLNLTGHCRYLQANITGMGDLDFDNFKADSISILKNGSDSWEWYWESKKGTKETKKSSKKHSTLLFNPRWNGVEAGLNMLLGSKPNAEFSGPYALLDLRPLRSWNFNFNIADVGLAFSYSHRAGIYTGIGLGWNNYSFNTPVRLEKGKNALICNAIEESVEGRVRKSKLGVLYLQMPLMVEFRPTEKSYIAIGVTGGLRIDTWTKVKFENGIKEKIHNDYYVNRFKLDASLRAGGRLLGFFAHYSLLPLFNVDKAPEAHTLSFGLSLNF